MGKKSLKKCDLAQKVSFNLTVVHSCLSEETALLVLVFPCGAPSARRNLWDKRSLKSRTWSVGADVVICLSTGQDGNIHMTWLCALGSGLAMVVLSSASVLVSVMSPMQ